MGKNNAKTENLKKVVFMFRDTEPKEMSFVIESTYSDGLDRVQLPFDICQLNIDKDGLKVQFCTENYQEDVTDFGYLKYLFHVDDGGDKKDDYYKRTENSPIFKQLNITEGVYLKNGEGLFPEIDYSDITEYELFGVEPISKTELTSNGLWEHTGIRKLKILFENKALYTTPPNGHKSCLYWYKADDKPFKDKIVFENKIRHQKTEDGKDQYSVYVDTNKLGSTIDGLELGLKPKVYGRFEAHIVYSDHKEGFSVPVELCLQKMCFDNKKVVDTSSVSIDFGTSSTCAAVMGEKVYELITVSGDAKKVKETDNRYENPTNILVYNWDELYRQWRKENKNIPYFVTPLAENGDYEAAKDDADYDSGYQVNKTFQELGDIDSARKMNAILRQLKQISFRIENGEEIKIYPYKKKSQDVVFVTDDVEKENINHFNPIAFYGFLLGRAINNPKSQKLYTTYLISYPVKFKKEIRDKICKSLEYGIRRSLPNTLKESENIRVLMKYSEPVSCIGSIIGNQLALPRPNKPQLFAVFDLGGGTLDFAFGVLRVPDDRLCIVNGEEIMEADEYELALDIFNVDGNEHIGGESLIHALSYKIYKDSNYKLEDSDKGQIEDKKIKFVIPDDELFNEKFEKFTYYSKNADELAFANLNSINELVSRPIFQWAGAEYNNMSDIIAEDSNVTVEADRVKIALKNDKGDDTEVTLIIDKIDEFLKARVGKTIEIFKKSLKNAFKKHESDLEKAGYKGGFNEKDVHVFLGGNASKQRYVAEFLQKDTDECPFASVEFIEFVSEYAKKAGYNKRYIINTKTAVAFGQLNLKSGIRINELYSSDGTNEMPPFQYCVWKHGYGEEYEKIIEKGDVNKDWIFVGPIEVNTMQTEMYITMSSDDGEIKRKVDKGVDKLYEETKAKWLYIRIYDESSVEYRLCKSRREGPSNDEAIREDCLIHLGEY